MLGREEVGSSFVSSVRGCQGLSSSVTGLHWKLLIDPFETQVCLPPGEQATYTGFPNECFHCEISPSEIKCVFMYMIST